MIEPPARPLSGFGALEVKDVAVSAPKGHKDFKVFQEWMTRNARARLPESVRGSGPKLAATLTIDFSGLREVGGLISSRWEGSLALDVAFRGEDGAAVARMRSSAPVPAHGQLNPAGDRLLDDVAEFLAAP